jgi:hypothetical protein
VSGYSDDGLSSGNSQEETGVAAGKTFPAYCDDIGAIIANVPEGDKVDVDRQQFSFRPFR